MEFHEYLTEAFRQDPDMAEKIRHVFGKSEIPSEMIKWWAKGLVVPSDTLQDEVVRFVESVGNVRMIRDTSPPPFDISRR